MRRYLLFLTCAIALHAQAWDALRGLKPGDNVKVQELTGAEHKGAFVSMTADAITLRTAKSEASVERTRIRRVQLRSSARRARNFAIGAAIGAVAGIIADQTLGTYLRNESNPSSGARALTYVAPIGILGGIAAARPAYRTIYEP
jgi:hypothetical protein